MSANEPTVPAPPVPPPETDGPDGDSAHLFPVVGVGASAGGLEAIIELLEGIPPDPGLAFLIAVHLDPHKKCHFPEILAKTTPLIVREVAEGMPVEVNSIYLIPPNTNMALTDGRLMLTPRTQAEQAQRNGHLIEH
jgi:two-component system CheB/CheR fusion protein